MGNRGLEQSEGDVESPSVAVPHAGTDEAATVARRGGSAARSRRTVLALAGAAALLISIVAPAGVLAQGTLALTTPYPAVAVSPGTKVSFDITVTTTERTRVDLQLAGVPDGWTASLRGGGYVVDGVMSDPSDPPKVRLDVSVPADAPGRSYPITLSGATGSVRDTLRLDVRVSEQVAGGVSMDTNVPAVTGSSTTTFTFSLTLHNDTAEDLTFALATQAPGEGWQVTAKPSAQAQAASVTVNAGSTSTISVDANPPDTVAAGKYPVSVTATAGDRTATADLLVEITGTYTMTLTTPDQRLNANGAAGSTIVRTLTVQNTGTADLVGVALTDSAPTGWTISFDTPKVDVPAGKSQDVNASIKPSNDAIAGDYVVTFTAATQDESIRSNVDIRVTVETSLVWAVVGIGLIVVTLGGLFWVFRRYGRR